MDQAGAPPSPAAQGGPHQDQPVYTAGAPLAAARAAVVMLHGRGATAADILTLAGELEQPGVAFVAPQAAGGSWYPERFLAPRARNEPWLSSALERVGELLAELEAAGLPAGRTLLLGFSQGACLALEYAARHPQRYGGLAGLSGALIGTDEEAGGYTGSLAGTPVFLGCSDIDPHIPARRVRQAAEALHALGGAVTLRLYAELGHTVNEEEMEAVRQMVRGMVV